MKCLRFLLPLGFLVVPLQVFAQTEPRTGDVNGAECNFVQQMRPGFGEAVENELIYEMVRLGSDEIVGSFDVQYRAYVWRPITGSSDRTPRWSAPGVMPEVEVVGAPTWSSDSRAVLRATRMARSLNPVMRAILNLPSVSNCIQTKMGEADSVNLTLRFRVFVDTRKGRARGFTFAPL